MGLSETQLWIILSFSIIACSVSALVIAIYRNRGNPFDLELEEVYSEDLFEEAIAASDELTIENRAGACGEFRAECDERSLEALPVVLPAATR